MYKQNDTVVFAVGDRYTCEDKAAQLQVAVDKQLDAKVASHNFAWTTKSSS